MLYNGYERTSLEERLQRIRAGNSSSPQYTRKIVDTFCSTPITPLLEIHGSYSERQKLAELLRGETVKMQLIAFEYSDMPRKSAETITFGDIALLITAHYLRYGTDSSEIVNQLLCIYFNALESMIARINKLPPREGLNSFLHPVYDFINMSFVEYYEYAMECGLDKYEDKIAMYREKTGQSSSMKPWMIFNEIKSENWGYDELCFDMDMGASISVEKCEQLIDFFVCPVAMVWMQRFIDKRQNAEVV